MPQTSRPVPATLFPAATGRRTTPERNRAAGRVRWPSWLLTYEAAAVAVVLLSVVARLHSGLTAPLWFDEAWTGALSSQKSWVALFHQIYDDVNAPLYYVVMFVWAKGFGLSNLALRAPNIIFGVLASGFAFFGVKRLSGTAAVAWCMLLASWAPGLLQSNDARCYGLLFLTATCASAAFAQLIATPTRKRALVWVAAASLALLTHYYAVFLLAAQAAVLLTVRRTAILRLWPAALGFAPAMAWTLFHLPRVLAFSRPDVAWYARLPIGRAPFELCYVFGALPFFYAALAVMILAVIARLTRGGPERIGGEKLKPLFAACAASLIGLVLCLAEGVARPSFTERYLTVFVPGALLGVAIAASYARGRFRTAPALVVGGALLTLVAFIRTPVVANDFSFEGASTFLSEADPQRLVFLWDNPTAAIDAPEQLSAVGGFFFARMGRPVQTVPVYLAKGADPNRALMALATPRSAILWVYDFAIHDTAAKRFPPRLPQLDPRWTCRNFASDGIGVIACRQPRPTP